MSLKKQLTVTFVQTDTVQNLGVTTKESTGIHSHRNTIFPFLSKLFPIVIDFSHVFFSSSPILIGFPFPLENPFPSLPVAIIFDVLSVRP